MPDPSIIIELPQWNLRAEFWIEGAGDDYGTDTTEAGTYLYLTTDQVRFYPIGSGINYAHAGGGGYTQYVRQDSNQPRHCASRRFPHWCSVRCCAMWICSSA